MIEEKLLTESFFSQRTSKIKRFVEVHRFARFLNKIVPKEKKIVLVGIGDPEVHADYVPIVLHSFNILWIRFPCMEISCFP